MLSVRRRVEKIEHVMRCARGKANPIIITATSNFTKDKDRMRVTINGESRFAGTEEECDRWINENLGPIDLKITIGG